MYSLRKWKDKLKEWGYEKHLSQSDMKILVAKGEKRLREEGKGTDFFHHGIEVPKKKIETFKKRKVVRESDPASPSACKSHRTLTTFLSSQLISASNACCYHLLQPTRSPNQRGG